MLPQNGDRMQSDAYRAIRRGQYKERETTVFLVTTHDAMYIYANNQKGINFVYIKVTGGNHPDFKYNERI